MNLSTFFPSSIRSLVRFTAPTRPPLFFFLLLCLERSALFANTAYHTPFLKSDGTVWATGRNDYGQLGDGSTTQRNNPVQVSDSSGNPFSNVAAVAAGSSHTIFLKSDGAVWATGYNNQGQLGDGSTANKSNPVQVSDSSGNPFSNVAAVAAGYYHTIFLKSDGSVWATGRNSEGQLGDGSTTQRNNPVQVTDSSGNPFSNVAAVAAGYFHTIFLKSDGAVWATGYNTQGQLGDGSTAQRNNPVQVTDSSGNPFSNVAAVAAGSSHTIFLKSDGAVWATGYNNFGQLGDGSTTSRSNPVQVTDSSGNLFSNVAAVAAGYFHTIFLKSDGAVWATGYNNEGQLGDGSTAQRYNPVQVTDSSGNPFSNVAAVAAGYNHTIFLKSDGAVWATGYNNEGQLGDGSTANKSNPVQVTDSSGNPFSNVARLSEHNATLTNNSPSNLNPTGALTILENMAAGTTVGEFNATDPDANSTLTYSLVAGAGDGNNSLFTLESNGTLKTAATLDYEAGATLSIRVKVQDENNASIDGNFTVQVTNQNEAPLNLTPSGVFSLAENQAAGTAVGSFTATDPDAGATLSFSLVDDNATSYASFNLSTAGTLTTAEILDFENNASHTLRVLVNDEFNASIEGNFTVTVTNVEETPIITFGGGAANATSNVSENQRGAASIAATEPDGQVLTYSITGGVDAALFAIDASTGELSFIANPDYEFPNDANQDNSYEVNIQVVDTVGNTASQSITVVVENMIDLSTAIFTNAGATGRFGPTQAQVNAAYTGTDLDGRVTINTQGIQEWTVPFSGMYSIEAWGAQGGGSNSYTGGLGARIKGEFSLTKDSVIKILVGQMGSSNYSHSYQSGGGGGGGTYILQTPYNDVASVLIIAGGGGGAASHNYQNNGQNAGITNSTNTSGGAILSTTGWNPGGGAGLISDGNSNNINTVAKSFINGGAGGQYGYSYGYYNNDGGFGGGGGNGAHEAGGGGGIYGGSTGNYNNSNSSAGGGGSYNSGINQLAIADIQGQGRVIISALNTPPSDISLSNHSLPENLPANSQVGLFSTTDPDDANGTGAYTYSLVSGTGDTDNALFNLDANGTLTILATSDYEQRLIDSNTTALLHTELNASFLDANYSADLHLTPQLQYPTWSIRVRTADDVNASYEEVVLIASLDRDDTIPVITFDGNGTRTQTPWTYIPPPVYDASDNVDGNITHLVITDGNLTTEQPGIYYLHHDVTDAAGNNATRITFALTVVNQNPTDLHLSNAFVEENLPVGTHVGIFTTTDPDDLNNTRPYTYQLIIDPSKAFPPFQLDTNGTLTTNAILDFEAVENYTIRIRTTDQFGGFYEEDFVIYVVDAFPPYVETGMANLGSDGRFTLYGTVVDEGGISGILERGFVISSKPITNLLDSGSTKLVSTMNDNNFSSPFTPALAGKKHFFRAYAISAESDFLGTEETFTPAAIPGPGYWSDAKASTAGADWWESSWFGSYYAPDTNQWIMHSELGWLFPSPSMEAGVWFWKDGLKWLWTDSKTFPFLHSIDQGSWLYFYGNVGEKRLFYAYSSQKWIVLKNGVIQENTTYSQNIDDTGQADNPDLTGQQAGTPTGDPK